MNNGRFWWLLTATACIGTFLYLLACATGQVARQQRIDDHSEIMPADTVLSDTIQRDDREMEKQQMQNLYDPLNPFNAL